MPRPTKDEKFASHLPETLAYHAKILSDQPRIAALQRGVETYVKAGTSFLDVGSGVGIWAVLAAKLGAARVVAVELEESLIPFIYKHAQENGVGDRIQIIHGNVDDVTLDENFDVIVAELFAGDVFSDETTRSIIGLRERFLADGGIIIPQEMNLYAVPVFSPHDPALPISTQMLDRLRLNYGQMTTADERRDLKFAAEPKLLKSLDYMTLKEPPKHEPMIAEWTLNNVSTIDSFMVFTTTQYAPDVVLDSRASKTWLIEKYGFVPFETERATIRFTANFDPKSPSWSISLPSHPETVAQNYSPIFGYTRAKMALAATPYKKTKRPTRSKRS